MCCKQKRKYAAPRNCQLQFSKEWDLKLNSQFKAWKEFFTFLGSLCIILEKNQMRKNLSLKLVTQDGYPKPEGFKHTGHFLIRLNNASLLNKPSSESATEKRQV